MDHNVNRIGLEPLPKVKAVYVPESQTLYIENGRLREDAEEMAENILVYYDKDDEASAVALCIDRAEHVLKPFVDAILAKYGVKPGQLQTSGEVKADASVPVRKVRRGGE